MKKKEDEVETNIRLFDLLPNELEIIILSFALFGSETEKREEKNKKAFAERQKQTKTALNDVKMKLRLPGRISDLENEPAFKRRNVSLDDVSHSSESSTSRFSINEEVERSLYCIIGA